MAVGRRETQRVSSGTAHCRNQQSNSVKGRAYSLSRYRAMSGLRWVGGMGSLACIWGGGSPLSTMTTMQYNDDHTNMSSVGRSRGLKFSKTARNRFYFVFCRQKSLLDSHNWKHFREHNRCFCKILVQDSSFVLIRCVSHQRRLQGENKQEILRPRCVLKMS